MNFIYQPTTTEETPTTQTTTTTILTTVTETVSSTTTPHIHAYVTETEIVEHEAEYQTKTVWMLEPMLYFNAYGKDEYGTGENHYCLPSEDPEEYFNEYDLICYAMGSWDAFVDEYKDDMTLYIDKTNFEEYGFTEEQWYDVEYIQFNSLYSYMAFGETQKAAIGYEDPIGNENPTFNPELDVIVSPDPVATKVLNSIDCDWLYLGQHYFYVARFMPVAQENVLVKCSV